MFEGYATWPHVNQGGNGGNFLRLHGEAQWARYVDGHQQGTGSVYSTV